jgi:hypothetical protein
MNPELYYIDKTPGSWLTQVSTPFIFLLFFLMLKHRSMGSCHPSPTWPSSMAPSSVARRFLASCCLWSFTPRLTPSCFATRKSLQKHKKKVIQIKKTLMPSTVPSSSCCYNGPSRRVICLFGALLCWFGIWWTVL